MNSIKLIGPMYMETFWASSDASSFSPDIWVASTTALCLTFQGVGRISYTVRLLIKVVQCWLTVKYSGLACSLTYSQTKLLFLTEDLRSYRMPLTRSLRILHKLARIKFHDVVYRLKSVGALEMKFVAPMPEQIATTTLHFLKVQGELC